MDKLPLRKCREEMGLSVNQVARETGIDRGNLSRIERGLLGASPDVAARLATFYGNRITEMQILYPERFTNGEAAA